MLKDMYKSSLCDEYSLWFFRLTEGYRGGFGLHLGSVMGLYNVALWISHPMVCQPAFCTVFILFWKYTKYCFIVMHFVVVHFAADELDIFSFYFGSTLYYCPSNFILNLLLCNRELYMLLLLPYICFSMALQLPLIRFYPYSRCACGEQIKLHFLSHFLRPSFFFLLLLVIHEHVWGIIIATLTFRLQRLHNEALVVNFKE